ncbi:MAG: serine hydrolase [Hyphomicrobiales bacterium]|nr:serine hydrolase [Hyphomicrobiales bacterium]
MHSVSTEKPESGLTSRAVRGALAAVLAAATTIFAVVSATAAPQLAFDLDSGKIYYQQDATKSWHPASITKLMTAYVTFRAIREGRISLGSAVVISNNALSEPPSKMGFKVGTVLTLDNALKMMIVKSANDIAVAVGETVSGSEAAFVAEMNLVSQSIGMTSTRWTNPNGLPDDRQVTTARDLGILVQALRRDFPQYTALFKISAIRHGKRVLRSHNRLLDRYRGANGMKTGFICASGFNLAASATRGGRTVVAIVLGARSPLERVHIAKQLLDRGFRARGLFMSGGGTTIEEIGRGRGVSAAPDLRPAICGKNRQRPGVEDLLADADEPEFSAASAFQSTRGADRDLFRIRSSSKTKKKKAKADNKKEDPYTLIVGPIIRNPAPVVVSIGGVDPNAPSGGRPSPIVALEPGVKTSAPGETPLPKMRPSFAAADNMPVGSEAETMTPEAAVASAATGLALPKPKPAR